MKIKAVIIDDEQNSAEMLEWLISTYCPEVNIIATYNDPAEAQKVMNTLSPDLVFLDIEMPGMNGFQFLEGFQKPTFDVVFTTAYNKFAIKAFRYSALNYLLKPVDPDELISTIQRHTQKKSTITHDQIELLVKSFIEQNSSIYPTRLALSTNDGMIFVETNQIVLCQADSNYTLVKLTDGRKALVAKTLKEFDETLSGKNFFRVHNSYLINLSHIKKFVRGDGGYIVMSDDTEITISRSRKDEFFSLFERF